MRIIIKPIGAIVIFLALIALAGMIFTLSQRKNKEAAPDIPGVAVTSAPRKNNADSTVIDPNASKWKMVTQAPAVAAMTPIIVPELPGKNKHAVHLVVEKVDPDKFWCAQMIKQVPQDVAGGKDMVVHFWGRSAQSTPVYVIFEEGNSPHSPDLQEKVTFTPQWKAYELPFRTTKAHNSPRANFCIKAGIQPGEIEVAGIYVEHQ